MALTPPGVMSAARVFCTSPRYGEERLELLSRFLECRFDLVEVLLHESRRLLRFLAQRFVEIWSTVFCQSWK
jgi:hypothetical protein